MIWFSMTKEPRESEFYHPDDDEWASIQEGVAVSAEEIAALLKPRDS